MNPSSEQVQKYAPVISSLVRTEKILQEEAWIREWRTKSSRYSSSNVAQTASYIERRIKEQFGAAKEEIFESGVENEFTRELASLINEYGNKAIDILSQFIIYETPNEELISQALLLLGRLEHSFSYDKRLWLLERALHHSSSRVRNAASYALASLDDPQAIPYLIRAIEREVCDELRNDMKQVLEQLESTQQCH